MERKTLSTRFSLVTRANGGSALDKIMYDIRKGKYQNYDNKEDPWFITNFPGTPEALAELIEKSEDLYNKRKAKAKLLTTLRVALPRNCKEEEYKEMAKKIFNKVVVDNNFYGICSYHTMKKDNPHLHITISTRCISPIDPLRLQKLKSSKFDYFEEKKAKAKNPNYITSSEQARVDIRDIINSYAELENQVDIETYAERGIDKISMLHEGYRGKKQEERKKRNEEIKEINKNIEEFNKDEKRYTDGRLFEFEKQLSDVNKFMRETRKKNRKLGVANIDTSKKIGGRKRRYADENERFLSPEALVFKRQKLPKMFRDSSRRIFIFYRKVGKENKEGYWKRLSYNKKSYIVFNDFYRKPKGERTEEDKKYFLVELYKLICNFFSKLSWRESNSEEEEGEDKKPESTLSNFDLKTKDFKNLKEEKTKEKNKKQKL